MGLRSERSDATLQLHFYLPTFASHVRLALTIFSLTGKRLDFSTYETFCANGQIRSDRTLTSVRSTVACRPLRLYMGILLRVRELHSVKWFMRPSSYCQNHPHGARYGNQTRHLIVGNDS